MIYTFLFSKQCCLQWFTLHIFKIVTIRLDASNNFEFKYYVQIKHTYIMVEVINYKYNINTLSDAI